MDLNRKDKRDYFLHKPESFSTSSDLLKRAAKKIDQISEIARKINEIEVLLSGTNKEKFTLSDIEEVLSKSKLSEIYLFISQNVEAEKRVLEKELSGLLGTEVLEIVPNVPIKDVSVVLKKKVINTSRKVGQTQRILELIDAGRTTEEIIKECGCKKQSVYDAKSRAKKKVLQVS